MGCVGHSSECSRFIRILMGLYRDASRPGIEWMCEIANTGSTDFLDEIMIFNES